MSKSKEIVKRAIPRSVQACMAWRRVNKVNRPIYNKVLREMTGSEDETVRRYAQLLREKGWLSVFLGDWTDSHPKHYEVEMDAIGGLFVTHNSPCGCGVGRMYFPNKWGKEECEKYYAGIMKEQDKESPHLYFTDELVENMDLSGTVIDCGAAEGVFVLDVVGGAKTVYCFEPDDLWKEPLKRTIEPYGDKCVLVEKFVGLTDSASNTIGLDDFFGENIPKDVKLVKMDIEGFEQDALLGMKRTLKANPEAILLVCAYHSQDAEKEIREIMEPLGYKVTPRKNYMLLALNDDAKYPYIRHGVLEIRR